MKNNKNYLSWALLALMAAALMFPEMAMAAPNFFTPQADDLSVSLLLGQFFGGAMPSGSGGGPGAGGAGTDPFASMLAIINAGALTIGGLLAAYTLVAGTMQTAHDGEMLGKKWSSMWLPIRTVLGIGLVVPTSSGYCVAQFLVMWLAVQGVGLADKVWTAFAKDGLSQLVASASAPSPKVQEFAIAALKMRTCMSTYDALNKLPSTQTITGGTVSSSTDFTSHAFWTNGSTTKGTKYGTTDQPDACGTVSRVMSEYELSSIAGNAIKGAGAGAVIGGVIGGVGGAFAGGVGAVPGAAGGAALGAKLGGLIGALFTSASDPNAGLMPIVTAHDTGYKTLMADLKPVADAIAQQSIPNGGAAPDLAAQGPVFDAAVQKYITAVQTAANGANADKMASLQTNAGAGGWIMAGSWFARVATIINGINQAVNMVPNADYNKQLVEGDQSATSTAMKNSMASVDKFYRSGTDIGSANAWRSSMGIEQEANSMPMQKKMEESMFAKKIVESMSSLDITRLQNDTRHPLITLQELGTSMMTSMALATAGLAGLSLIPGGVGSLIAPLIGLVVFAGISASAVLAIYTPMMPFLIFLGAAFGWVLLVVEAMVAAPLWAIMHLSPAGDDMMGSARNGYSLLLSLMLRPALIVVGFGASILVVYPLGMFLNLVFFNTFIMSAANGGNFFTAFMLIAGTVVYAAVLMSLLHKAFALTHKIPDELLKWFGGAGASLGQSSEQMAGGARGAMATVGQTASQLGSQGAQLGVSGRQMMAQREQNQLSKNNAATGAVAASGSAGSKADLQSQKAWASKDPSEHLEAVGALKNSSDNKMQAATALRAAGKGDEANAYEQGAKADRNSMKEHVQELGRMSAGASSAASAATATAPTTSSEAVEKAATLRDAASASRAHATAMKEEASTHSPTSEAAANLQKSSQTAFDSAKGFEASAAQMEALGATLSAAPAPAPSPVPAPTPTPTAGPTPTTTPPVDDNLPPA